MYQATFDRLREELQNAREEEELAFIKGAQAIIRGQDNLLPDEVRGIGGFAHTPQFHPIGGKSSSPTPGIIASTGANTAA